MLLCVISLLTTYKGFFEPLVLPPEFVGGLDGFVAFVAETFIFLCNLVEILCELGECMTGHFLGGGRQGGWWLGPRTRQVELCHTDAMMSTTRPCQPKNHQCMQCKRWYTAKGIGNHIQNCMKWDDAPPSPRLSELGNASDDGIVAKSTKFVRFFGVSTQSEEFVLLTS